MCGSAGSGSTSIIFGTTYLASDEDILAALSEISPKVRYQVGKEVKLRFVPEINFFIDDTYEKAQKIDQILESVHEKSVSQGA